MCGIVGLFLKDRTQEASLGPLLRRMLVSMTERGPDSTGFAIYRDPAPADAFKYSLFSHQDAYPWENLALDLRGEEITGDLVEVGSHAVAVTTHTPDEIRAWLRECHPAVQVVGYGRQIEIFKDVGKPEAVANRFALGELGGSHALGHTRMATESAVTTEGSHPFAVGQDLCLVHNGSLSNHNDLRRELAHQGITCDTENDSEVAAAFLWSQLAGGSSLETALEAALRRLDGFFTFAIGTEDGFAVVRDRIACKPAVMAESDRWVAMASEYRALADLPGIADAQLWEPEPGRIYSWSHEPGN